MASILDYKFYLNFKNTDSFGRIQITEPIGFDGSSFVIEQEDSRFGRDAYKFNEEISLSFYKGQFDSANTHSQLPNGTVIYNLTMGFEWILETYKRWGFESDVDFEIELDGLVFIPSNLDFQNSDTDGYTYFTCKAVQEQGKQLIKRRSDIVTDIFSTEDLDGNTVTPAVTENILLKAKPDTGNSEWESIIKGETRQFIIFGGSRSFNLAPYILKQEIQDTLSFFPAIANNPQDFKYIRAVDDLTDVTIEITDLVCYLTDTSGGGKLRLRVIIAEEDSSTYYQVYELDEIGNGGSFDSSYSLTINSIPRGQVLLIDFRSSGDGVIGEFGTMNIKIKATATAIDTVIKGVRYIDVFKENIKRINGFGVVSPKYDVGGIYYDQFATTGNLIKQRDDVSFNVEFSEITDDLLELCGGRQTLSDRVYINRYEDFYPNKEIGVFISSPTEEFKSSFNPRYAINEFEYKYSNFEQDDDESNTTDAIHTETQWLLSNKQVENTKSIDVKLIRDAFKLEKTRKDAVKETTSTDDDDKMFLLDVVTLAPSTRGGFTAFMTHNVNDDDELQLLKDADLPSWALLGFDVGSLFYVDSDDNNGTYTVTDIEDTIITLTGVGFIPTYSGAITTTVSYPFTNVLYTNRTDEGLEYAENLLNSTNYANLRYSIKRNMEAWKPYLATASKYRPDGTFKNTYFKDNGACITRFEGEPENIQEDADILNADLGDGILTPLLYETTLLAPYNEMVDLIESIDTINDDDTIGGFIRCIDNNGRVIKLYPQKLEYLPSTEVLTLTGEERNEGNGVEIVIEGDIIYINQVGYDTEELSEPFYEFDGDYFKIYDINKLPIINPTKYDEITVNGSSFDSSSDLLGYLIL